MYPRERAAEALARPTDPGRETPCLPYVELELASTEREAGDARNAGRRSPTRSASSTRPRTKERRREGRI